MEEVRRTLMRMELRIASPKEQLVESDALDLIALEACSS